MKRILRLTVTLGFSLLAWQVGWGQTLSAGDIAFVQYNADGTDNFAFVSLADIPAGEIIYFTDNEENSLGGGEGTIRWVAPAGGVACGTVVTITTTPSTTVGSVTEPDGDLNFAGGGDAILAYYGPNLTGSTSSHSATYYIAALSNDGGSWGGAADGNLPAGLTDGTNAVALTEVDNAAYTGTTTGTIAGIRSAINTDANWTARDNSTQQTFSGTFSLSDCGGSAGPAGTNPGDIIITEFMPDPSQVSDNNGEYIEIYNTTASTITIDNNWTLEDAASNTYTFSGTTVINAGSYIVLTIDTDPSQNGGITGGVNYDFVNLNNGSESIILINSGTVIAQIDYDATWPWASGVAASLDPGSLNATDYAVQANWCGGKNAYGDGDLGTPGVVNDLCNCALTIDGVVTTCDAFTAGTDTYTTTVTYSGGGTEAYSIVPTTGVLDLTGANSDPTSNASGQFQVTGVNEGTSFDINISSASCTGVDAISIGVTSPSCAPVGATEGLIINEFSQGTGSLEYIELLVVGTPGDVVDLRGWIVDDNSGIFSNGYGSQLGIADGHIKFTDICTWEQVPVGSIIVIYSTDNAGVGNGEVPAEDPTDANNDYVYVFGIEQQNSGQCASAPANDYFSSDCSLPNNTSFDTYTPAVYQNPDWFTIIGRNGGDALQTRTPLGTFFHGLSYGSEGSVTGCSGGTGANQCDLIVDNHPLFGTYGSDALYFSGTSNRVYEFVNTTDNDFNKLSNWESYSTADATTQTPGDFNNLAGGVPANENYILALRTDFPINDVNDTYTCILRENEARNFIREDGAGQDNIYLRVVNNENVDRGDITGTVTYENDGSVNLALPDRPYFHSDIYEVTVTNDPSNNANYDITIYLSDTELADLTAEYNAELTAFGFTGAARSTSDVLGGLRIYKSEATDPATATGGVDNTSTAIVNYTPGTNPGYAVTGTFTSGFSSFRLAVVLPQNVVFPVEWVSFTGEDIGDKVMLEWETAEEINNEKFEILRSADRSNFEKIGEMPAGGANKHSYRFVDAQPLTGTNYYRLKQIDFDGKSSLSNTIQVNFATGAYLEMLRAYPNPTEGLFSFDLNVPDAGEVSVSILNPAGQQVWGLSQQRIAGQQTLTADLSELAGGMYFYELRYQGQTLRGRFLKQ